MPIKNSQLRKKIYFLLSSLQNRLTYSEEGLALIGQRLTPENFWTCVESWKEDVISIDLCTISLCYLSPQFTVSSGFFHSVADRTSRMITKGTLAFFLVLASTTVYSEVVHWKPCSVDRKYLSIICNMYFHYNHK